MDININSRGAISIKDEKDIDLNDLKWDFIFKNSILNEWEVYFIGWRLDFIYKAEINKDLEKLIETFSSKVLIDKDNHMRLFLKFQKLERKCLNDLWRFYEYPSVFFLKNSLNEVKLIEQFDKGQKNILLNNGFCHLYKMDPEIDVLWIEKSSEVIFQNNEKTI